MQNHQTALTKLRYRWGATAVLYGLSLGAGFHCFPADWHHRYLARSWAVVAGTVLLYLLWVFWHGLTGNHRPGEAILLDTLGPGNTLTLLRSLAVGLLAGFLFLPRPAGGLFAWTPTILYTFISVFDYLDGYTARKTNHATQLGAVLDGVCDALGLLVAVGLAVWYGQLPGWYLILGLARYLFLAGLGYRQRRGKPVYDLPPSDTRRMLAGFQMGFITVMLWPMFSPPATTLAGVIFAAPFLAGFWRDWLAVSGKLNPAGPVYRQTRAKLKQMVNGWLPVALRLGVMLLTLKFLLPIALNSANRRLLLAWPGAPQPVLAADALGILLIISSLLLTLGLLPRLAALGLLTVTAMTILSLTLTWWNGILLAETIALTLLGGGHFSLWQPDGVFVTTRAGEKT